MPKVRIVMYKDSKGRVPFEEWFGALPERAQDKCLAKLIHLAEFGHALRRPDCDNLGEGIWELRVKSESVNFRILYFFYHREIVVLSHGIKKQRAEVPRKEIATAKKRMKEYLASPSAHTVEEYLW